MKRKGMAMVLCFVLLAAMLPVQVQAEERAQIARSSDFIDDYNINFYSVGGGKVRIAFEVYATSVMDDVGATRILLYGGPSADQLLPVENVLRIHESEYDCVQYVESQFFCDIYRSVWILLSGACICESDKRWRMGFPQYMDKYHSSIRRGAWHAPF